jgi:hypothetical protein
VTDPGARHRAVAVALTVLLVGTGLSSCSRSESYCGTLKGDRKELSALAKKTSGKAGGSQALARTVSLLSKLRDEAPDDIRDDWDTLVQALDGLSAAVKASGADPADFNGGRRPAGVTEGQYRAVRQAAAELQATPVEQATKSIEQHALDVCKVDLSSELGSTS